MVEYHLITREGGCRKPAAAVTKQRTAANKLTTEMKGNHKTAQSQEERKETEDKLHTGQANGRKTVKSSQSIITLTVGGIKHPQLNAEFSSWMKRQAPCLQE